MTQEALIVPAASVVHALARTLANIAATNPKHKTVVFFTTARVTGYFATLFSMLTFPNP